MQVLLFGICGITVDEIRYLVLAIVWYSEVHKPFREDVYMCVHSIININAYKQIEFVQ